MVIRFGPPLAIASAEPEVSKLARRALSTRLRLCPRPPIAEIAALIGNSARANVLTALLDGRALTATELRDHTATCPP
jgi:hypothetical protein